MESRLKKQILEMKEEGLTHKEIGQELGLSYDQVKAALRTKKYKKDFSHRFDFDEIVEFFKQGKNKHDVIKEFAPDKNIFYYDSWRSGLSQSQRNTLDKYEQKRKIKSHVLKDVKISRKFKYLETSEDAFLPIGLK